MRYICSGFRLALTIIICSLFANYSNFVFCFEAPSLTAYDKYVISDIEIEGLKDTGWTGCIIEQQNPHRHEIYKYFPIFMDEAGRLSVKEIRKFFTLTQLEDLEEHFIKGKGLIIHLSNSEAANELAIGNLYLTYAGRIYCISQYEFLPNENTGI
jgi:hypothetical protein